MFELRLSHKEGNLDVVSLRSINCIIETGLFLKNNRFDEMITKFVLNAILHHVGMSWIISSNKEMKYEMDENIHQDWLNKGPWYNTSICLKFHGSRFEDFITQARTYIYSLMCSLVAHDKLQPDYKNDENSIGDMSIPDNATPKSLEALGATTKCAAQINATEEMFNQIPKTMKKALTPKQKVQKLMTDIGGGWYMEKSDKGLPPLRRTKLSKKAQ